MRSLSRAALAASARLVLTSVLIVMAVGAISVGLRFEQLGGRVLSVQTGSMRPSIQPGDGLIVWRQPTAKLLVGQIISYRSSVDPRVIISHRIVAIGKNGSLTTKGDALSRADPPVAQSAIMGRARAIAPNLGKGLNRLRSPIGLGVTIYLPAILIIVSQIRRLSRTFAGTGYSLRR